MSRTHRLTLAALAFAALALAPRPADAQLALSYTNIDIPNTLNTPTYSWGDGISSSGNNIVLDQYIISTDVQHGYVLSNGSYTQKDYPGTQTGVYTALTAVNNSGTVLGQQFNDNTGQGTINVDYVETSGGSRTTLPVANSISPILAYNSISNNGKIAAARLNASGVAVASIYDPVTGKFDDLPSVVPGYRTTATYIAANGDVLVDYRDQNGVRHGAIYHVNSGTYTLIPDTPVGTERYYLGVNSRGLVLGEYTLGSRDYGFLYDGFAFTTIDTPDILDFRIGSGVSESGQVVGSYLGTDGLVHATLITAVPEPGTVALFGGMGVVVSGLLLRRRKPAPAEVLRPLSELGF